ncbi:MAG: hypothetical protein LC734_03725, partial [Acidobacteria bacterium]|nr:hypothetical protein [Acidobacteriota bacterium]
MSGEKQNAVSGVRDEAIEFVLEDAVARHSSFEFAGRRDIHAKDLSVESTSARLSSKESKISPAASELAVPKLPKLERENRARLQMQSPNKLFFYWTVKSNPYRTLNRAIGAETGSYTLVLKLIDKTRGRERVQQIDGSG